MNIGKVTVNRVGQDVRDPTHRCKSCIGSGKQVGGGMIMVNCPECKGDGFIAPPKIDKQSQHYKTAIKNLKKINADMTDAEAEALFEKEYNKI